MTTDDLRETDIIEIFMKLMCQYEIDELQFDSIKISKSRHTKPIHQNQTDEKVEVDDDLFVLERPKFNTI